MTKNKTGSETTIGIYWFAIIVIISGAVIYMISVIYGQPYDVRTVEAEAMASNVADCVSYGGYVNSAVFTPDFKSGFMQKCGLNFDTESTWQSGQYYAEVNVYDFESGQKLATVSGGNSDLKQFCGLKGNTLPVCSTKTVYGIDSSKKGYRIDILSIVRKTEKNVQ